jgi:HK97 family phage major capsid protein
MEDTNDTLVRYGGAIKAELLEDGSAKLAGYLVQFTTPTDLDLAGDFFSKDTDLGVEDGSTLPVYYHHGLDNIIKNRRLGKAKATFQDTGLWLEAQLAMRDDYEKAIFEMAEQGKLGWSSGAASHLVSNRQIGEASWIEAWPIAEASLTPTPAEPRNTVIPLKSLLSEYQQRNAEPQPTGDAQGAGDAPQSEGDGNSEAVKSTNMEGINMDDKNKDEVITLTVENLTEVIESAADAGAKEALKAYRDAEPVADPGNAKDVKVEVTHDPADNLFSNIAEQCVAVKNWTVSSGQTVDPRLTRIKATGASEAVPSEGGFLLEPTLVGDFLTPLHEEGPFTRNCRKLPVGNNSNYGWINGVDETSRADASRWGGILGYRLAEGGTKTPTKPKFRRINWELKKYAVLVYGTDELLADAAQFSAVVRQGCSEELMFMANDDILNGLGVGGPLGILNSGALITADAETAQATATFVYENIPAMWQRLHPRYRANSAWYINSEVEPELDELYLAAGTAGLAPRYVNYGSDGVMTIKGRPVYVTEFNAALGTAGDVLLADMREYLFWEKQGIQSAQSIHVQFVTDETVFRFVYRCDGQPALAAPLTPYKGTATQGPFVVMATRS